MTRQKHLHWLPISARNVLDIWETETLPQPLNGEDTVQNSLPPEVNVTWNGGWHPTQMGVRLVWDVQTTTASMRRAPLLFSFLLLEKNAICSNLPGLSPPLPYLVADFAKRNRVGTAQQEGSRHQLLPVRDQMVSSQKAHSWGQVTRKNLLSK
jgi:hypothetical protein